VIIVTANIRYYAESGCLYDTGEHFFIRTVFRSSGMNLME